MLIPTVTHHIAASSLRTDLGQGIRFFRLEHFNVLLLSSVFSNLKEHPLYEKLRRLKKICRTCFENSVTAFLNLIPSQARVYFKSKIQIVRPMDFPDGEIWLNVDSAVEYEARLHSCEREPEILEWIKKFFKKNDIFYDIGANVGAYALVATKLLDNQLTVYAFEPGFQNFHQLNKNILLNKCSEYIIALPIALSDQTNLDTFYYNNLIAGGALHTLGSPIDYKGDRFKPVCEQKILAYRLDDFIAGFKIPAPNHLKLDVDGIEFKILKGASRTLASAQLRTIFVEVEEGKQDAGAMIDFLGTYGFKLTSKYKCSEAGDTGPLAKVYNYIFERK